MSTPMSTRVTCMLMNARIRSSTSWSSARCMRSRVMSSSSSALVPWSRIEAATWRTRSGRSMFLVSAP